MSPGEPAESHFHAIRELFLSRIPFHRVLGLDVVEITAGRVELRVPFRPELIGDPERPALHGGVLSALADSCGGCVVWSVIGPRDRVSTIDLRVDYLRPGRAEELRAVGEVLRVGNRVGVAGVRLFHADRPTESVAEAKGVYSVRRARD